MAFDLGGVVVDVDLVGLSTLGDHDVVEGALFGDGRHDAVSVGALSGEAFAEAAAARLGIATADVVAAWQRVVRFSAGGLALVKETARDHPVAIWSNTDPLHWGVLGGALEQVAVDVAPSFRLGCMKPDPAYFARALARLDVASSDVLFIDDRQDNVDAARTAGVVAVQVRGVDAARSAIAAWRAGSPPPRP